MTSGNRQEALGNGCRKLPFALDLPGYGCCLLPIT
jgi:hypothetical protein